MGVLSELEPKRVFYYFEQICSIPHGSYHEKKISDYCVEFAKANQLDYIQDDLYNVIIKKAATIGYENEPVLILQGHLDMVCEKESECKIDFENDGLELMVEDGFVKAKGTTLGGDDGIAVAIALAILESNEISHPALEVIFTVSEEVGMEGAAGIDLSMLNGRRLLNLDSENEGIFTVGCAGGARIDGKLPVRREKAKDVAIRLLVTGLNGGHSGVEIDKGRANANILLGRVLTTLAKESPFQLALYEGGTKDNVITRESCAVICVKDNNEAAKIKQKMGEIQQEISNEYAVTDTNARIVFEIESDCPQMAVEESDTKKILLLLNSLPNGIQSMSADVPGLVETSLNLGILKLDENQFEVRYSVRSSVGSAKQALLEKIEFIVEGLGGTAGVSGIYPAWEYQRESKLRDKMTEVYEKMYGRRPKIEAIHAGLECGFLADKLPGLDAVSIGPDIIDIHTTGERLDIASVGRVWEYILEVLMTKDSNVS